MSNSGVMLIDDSNNNKWITQQAAKQNGKLEGDGTNRQVSLGRWDRLRKEMKEAHRRPAGE